jgi:hypothetical protein
VAYIRTIPQSEARGALAEQYDAAMARAGKIFNVIAIQGLQPRVLAASTNLYVRVMQAPGEPLARAQREMIATFVSRLNGCEY